MLGIKNISWQTSAKKERCRTCAVSIAVGTTYAIFVSHGRNRKGYSYEKKESFCAPCAVGIADRALSEVKSLVNAFVASAPGV